MDTAYVREVSPPPKLPYQSSLPPSSRFLNSWWNVIEIGVYQSVKETNDPEDTRDDLALLILPFLHYMWCCLEDIGLRYANVLMCQSRIYIIVGMRMSSGIFEVYRYTYYWPYAILKPRRLKSKQQSAILIILEKWKTTQLRGIKIIMSEKSNSTTKQTHIHLIHHLPNSVFPLPRKLQPARSMGKHWEAGFWGHNFSCGIWLYLIQLVGGKIVKEHLEASCEGDFLWQFVFFSNIFI